MSNFWAESMKVCNCPELTDVWANIAAFEKKEKVDTLFK